MHVRADCCSVIRMRTLRRFLSRWSLAATLSAIALGGTPAPSTASTDIPSIAQRQRTEKKSFTDSEIVEGFLKTAFGAEYHLAGRVDRIRKYDGPVRVFADGNRADRKAQLSKIVADIAARVQHLDIAMAETNEDANVQVKLVRDRDLQRTIATFYGSERAKEIRSSLDPQCSAPRHGLPPVPPAGCSPPARRARRSASSSIWC